MQIGLRTQTISLPETSRVKYSLLSKLGVARIHFLSRLELQFSWDFNGIIVKAIV